MPKIVDWSKIDILKHFVYHPPKQNQNGGFKVKVEVIDPETGIKVPFIHQGPKLRIPFGFEHKQQGDTALCYCTMTFPGVCQKPTSDEWSGDSEIVNYLEFIRSIENNNKRMAKEQCMTWFKKSISEDTISEFYHTSLRDPRDPKKYSPTFTTKIVTNGENATKFFIDHTREIRLSDIQVGSEVIPLIEVDSIWFANKSFGMSFRVIQLGIVQRDKFVGCAINFGYPSDQQQDDDNDEDDDDGPVSKRIKLNEEEQK